MMEYIGNHMELFSFPQYLYIVLFCIGSLCWFFGTDIWDTFYEDFCASDDDFLLILNVIFFWCIVDFGLAYAWSFIQPFHIITLICMYIFVSILLVAMLCDLLKAGNKYFKRKRGKL